MKQHEQAILLLDKARQDEALVEEVLASSNVSDEIIGFHCQQAAEKILKALLAERGIRFHRTHNLRQLMDTVQDAGLPIPPGLQDLDTLTPFAAMFRYEAPPLTASLDRPRARQILRTLRAWAEPLIRSPGKP
jgi:HEPN domain-containing protein